MISGLIKSAMTMAGFAASAKFTKLTSQWLSSTFRQGVHALAKSAAARDMRGQSLFKAVAKYSGDSYFNSSHALHRRVGSAVERAAQTKLTRSQYRAYGWMKRSVKDEGLFLPANYLMYRTERSAAVTPEEKESTSSFMRYYAGMPMAFSIGASTLMYGNKGRFAKTAAHVARRFSPEQRRGAYNITNQVVQRATEVGNTVGNYMAAASATRARVTENRSILSLVGRYRNSDLIGAVRRTYREELHRAQRQQPSTLDTVLQQLGEFRSKMEAERDRKVDRMRTKGTHTPEAINSFAKSYDDLIEHAERQTLDAHSARINRSSRTMRFVNKQIDSLRAADHSRRDLYKTVTRSKRRLTSDDFSWIGDKGLDVYEGPGIYNVNGKRTDFGRISFSALRDSVIKRSQRGAPDFVLNMFGIREMLDYRQTSHAHSLAFTSTRSGSLFFPKSYYSTDYAKNPFDRALNMYSKMTGLDKSDDNLKALLKDRIQLLKNRNNMARFNQGADMAVINGAFGELPLRRGDTLMHLPDGRMKLVTNVGANNTPVSFNIGAHEGSFMEFLKFTRNTNSTPVRLMRNFLGRFTGTLGEQRVTAGPRDVGRVIDYGEATGVLSWMKRKLELGYSRDRSVFSAVASIFTKHTDARYQTTLYSKRYLENRNFVRDVISKDTLYGGSMSNVEDLVSTMREHSMQAMDEFYMRTLMHQQNTAGVVSLVTEASNHAQLKTGPHEFMITPDMTATEARSRVAGLKDLIREVGSRKDTPAMGYIEDIDALRTISDVLYEVQDHVGLDIMTRTKSGRKVFSRGKNRHLSLMDAYNSDVLRVVSGLGSTVRHFSAGDPWSHHSLSEFFSPSSLGTRLSESMRVSGSASDVASFSVSSHLSKTYHLINASYMLDKRLGSAPLSGSAGRIENILSSFTGSVDYSDVLTYNRKALRLKPFVPWNKDPRLTVEPGYSDEVFMIPKSMGLGGLSRAPVDLPGGNRVEIAQGVMDTANISVMTLFHAFNRAASEFLGIGLDETTTPTPGSYYKKMLTKRVLPGMGLYMGYSLLDRAADQFLDGTPLGEGLTVFGANIVAGARVAAQGILDVTHATDLTSYLEDLMPGIISSPLSGAIRGFGPVALGMTLGSKRGGPRGALMGGAVGSAMGLLLGGGPLGIFGEWSIDKYRAEVVEELTGRREVPIRKGRFWELNSSPFEGTRIQYFRPHMYAMLRSKYDETPGFKDSIFTELAGAIMPDIYAMKNYYSRPYPVTAGLFSNLPVFGNMIGMVPGLSTLTGAGISMHEGEDSPGFVMHQAQEMGINTAQIARMYNETSGLFTQTEGSTGGFDIPQGVNSPLLMAPRPMNRSNAEWAIGESITNVKDLVGLRGFMMGSLFEGMTGRADFFDYAPELATPLEAAGIRREYWDMELGGILGGSEIIRRYIPHRRNQVQLYNPIRNDAPVWLPGSDYFIDFQHGDRFTLVPMGEARLPGAGYETLHDVDLTFPLEAEMLGMATESQIDWFLGKPDFMSYYNRQTDVLSAVKEDLISAAAEYGRVLKKSTAVYNSAYDVHATADAVIQSQTGEKLAVRVVPKGFAGESTLNAFMVMSDIEAGILVEADASTGEFSQRMVTRDATRFNRELSKARKSAITAYNQIREMDKEGDAYNLANAYSWFDRYRILADVAPYSAEFKEATAVVKQQLTAGTLSPRQVGEFYQVADQVEQKTEAIPSSEYRFLTIGESLTPYGKARDEFYQNEYSYLEQKIGSLWERFSHLRTPVHSKFLHHNDPLEEYERNVIYGKSMKMWGNPYEDYIKSYAYSMIGEDSPVQGALSWATGGMLLGGFPVAAAMGIGGAVTGAINNLTGNTFVPERVTERRNITNQMDAVKYAKYMQLYNETGDDTYRKKAGRTMTGASLQGMIPGTESIGYYLGKPERDYVESIINNVTTSNIHRVTDLLPTPAVATMYRTIGQPDSAQLSMLAFSDQQQERKLPGLGSSIYDAAVPLESPAIQTFEMQGLNAHDAGMGWYSQMAALERGKRFGTYRGESLFPESDSMTIAQVRDTMSITSELRRALSKYGSNVMIVDDGIPDVTVEIITGPGSYA